jgi:hypothetical protein
MAEKEIGDVVSIGTEAWNVADGYTKIKILRNLILLDRWEIIAQFGTEEMGEDAIYDQNGINKRRVEALNRFVSTLRQLIGNVKFAIKKGFREELKDHEERLDTVKDYLQLICDNTENAVTHEEELQINEEIFKKIFLILQDIKDKLNFPINASGLIFRESSEIDLDKIMNEIVEGG